ncbi:MAG: signal recognition particle protein [Gammaproteobacteria bacterium]|nr:signal recognition particle protein [Gammaproteobacteria bacterium]
MFDNLSQRLNTTLQKLRGQGRITESNIEDSLREVRMALLEADVALPVVKTFVAQVKERAIGQEVLTSLTPGQAFIKIVSDELTQVMGEANESLQLNAQPPAVVLMAGLQGAGKTTTVAKLAKLLKEKESKKVLVVSVDVYRPAAIQQLATLAEQVGVDAFPSDSHAKPGEIAALALSEAKNRHYDVLLVDTAGRLHVDDVMMAEIKDLHAALNPIETLFVVDSMTGQDAANTAKAFDEALPLTGVILTKTDGDANGGAALSIRQITGKPIKFMGVSEKIDGLEPFYPDRLASRILGKGDVVSLVEDLEGKIDHEKAEKLAKKIQKGRGFDMNDLRDQFAQMSNMGGIAGLMDKLPGMGNMSAQVNAQAGEKEIGRMSAIISSMTPGERSRPDIIKGSRKRRIASGSGVQIQDVNRLLKQFKQMQKMMKKMKGGGMMKMMRGLKGGGGMPGMPF